MTGQARKAQKEQTEKENPAKPFVASFLFPLRLSSRLKRFAFVLPDKFKLPHY